MSRKRPDGSGQLKAGALFMAISIIAFLVSAGTDVTTSTGGLDADGLTRRGIFSLASGLTFALAITLLCVGWIIQAISFLPGREGDEGLDATEGRPDPLLGPKASAILVLAAIAIAGLVLQRLFAPGI